jgi:hypothetical protein
MLILKIGGILFIIIFFIFMGTKLITPTPSPTAAFGKLSAIQFPKRADKNVSYSLDTLTGYLPNFSDRTKVYEITPNQPTLLGLDKTREKVKNIGFSSSGVQMSEDTYQWVSQDKALQRKIIMNIFSSDFTFYSSYLTEKALQTFSGADTSGRTVEVAKKFLSDMSLFPQDIDENKTKINLFSIINGTLIPTSKITDTKIMEINFFQKDVNNLPIYYQEGKSSTIYFLIGKENNQLIVVDGRFFYKNISKTSSDYAIKTASEAYLELQNGEAYIANNQDGAEKVTIKKVLLGYYIGEKSQEFLMPIIVFEGDNNFIAYVSAVKNEWINN